MPCLQLETGEFFLNENARQAAKRAEKREKQTTKTEAAKLRRAAAFVPPAEPDRAKTTAKRDASDAIDLAAIKKKVKNSGKRNMGQ